MIEVGLFNLTKFDISKFIKLSKKLNTSVFDSKYRIGLGIPTPASPVLHALLILK